VEKEPNKFQFPPRSFIARFVYFPFPKKQEKREKQQTTKKQNEPVQEIERTHKKRDGKGDSHV